MDIIMKGHYEYYGGIGFGNCKEYGRFEVATDDYNIKKFNKLSDAKKYYNSIRGKSKAIWDVSLVPELLDCQIWEE